MYAALMYIPSVAAGERPPYLFALGTRSLGRPLRLVTRLPRLRLETAWELALKSKRASSANSARRTKRITALIKWVSSYHKAILSNIILTKSDTYGAPYEDGTIAQGGYSSHIRAHEYFTFKIPDNISSTDAGPMMCAGITVWSPLVRAKTGPGKKVAILGV